MTTVKEFEAALDVPRLAITGGPRSGKTTLSGMLAHRREDDLVLHTDDLIGEYTWSDISAKVVELCAESDRFLVEGVRVAHALRKGLRCDAVIFLEGSLEDV
jgi:broad-specificity NMP kinase